MWHKRCWEDSKTTHGCLDLRVPNSEVAPAMLRCRGFMPINQGLEEVRIARQTLIPSGFHRAPNIPSHVHRCPRDHQALTSAVQSSPHSQLLGSLKQTKDTEEVLSSLTPGATLCSLVSSLWVSQPTKAEGGRVV